MGDTPPPPEIRDSEIFTCITQSGNELLTIFYDKIMELKGECYKVTSIKEAASNLKKIIRHMPDKSVLVQPTSLISQVLATDEELLKYIDQKVSLAVSSVSFAGYQAGITGADYLVARTGSIIINCKSAGGRRLSVLPPVHIVLAKKEQIVPSLDVALNQCKAESLYASFMTIISGPSRTSDIEKQLVLGAHGPKRLEIILIT